MPAQKYRKLQGKHVLVIGGTSGLGYAVAEASLESGASVTVSSSSPSRVQAAISGLQTSYPGTKVAGYACDLSKPTVEQDIEALFAQTGKVDHIVFTAGDKLDPSPLQETTLQSMYASGQVRFFAPLLVAKVGARYLSPGPESSITLTTGSVAEHPQPGWAVIAGFGAGLHGMARNLALDLKPIRVNLVSPGAVETPLWNDIGKEAKEALFKQLVEKHPTGRIGQPEDVAEAYLWLMKDANATGTVAYSNSGREVI